MSQSFFEFAKTGLYKAHQLGADGAEIFVMKNKELEVQIKDDNLDEIKQAEGHGVGIRVIKKHRQGFAYSSDFRSSALDKMVYQAVKNSQYNDMDPALHFPKRSDAYATLDLFDWRIGQLSLDEKIDLVKETVEHALKYDSQVARIERAGYEEGEVEMWLANSNDLILEQKGSYCGLFCLALGQRDTEQQSGYGMDSGIRVQQLSPRKAGEMAGLRAVRLLGAQSMGSQVADLVLDPYITVQIIGIISSCFSGEAVLKGKSFLSGKLGQQIASKNVTLVDDGTMINQLGSACFDGEGVATGKTILVENGVLQHYLYDTVTAAKAKTCSTGNGVRGSYKGIPHIGTTNYYMEAGELSLEQLLLSVDRGLYVTEILGAHTANPISGDFSFGASGIWLENGKAVKPVRGFTIAGNFKELLQKIDGVANNLTFYGSKGAPTVKISQISISGV